MPLRMWPQPGRTRTGMSTKPKGIGMRRSPRAEERRKKSYANLKATGTRKSITAQGDAQRFVEMCSQYQGNEQVTSSRLYLETMEQTMTKMQKVVVDSDNQKKAVDLKIIELEE